jgi:hypothetical protein
VFDHRHHLTAQRAGGRLVAGDDEEDAQRDQLPFRETVRVTGLHETGDEVGGLGRRANPPLGDRLSQEGVSLRKATSSSVLPSIRPMTDAIATGGPSCV